MNDERQKVLFVGGKMDGKCINDPAPGKSMLVVPSFDQVMPATGAEQPPMRVLPKDEQYERRQVTVRVVYDCFVKCDSDVDPAGALLAAIKSDAVPRIWAVNILE